MRRALKRASFAAFFALDRLGLHVLPKHYYTPVPDFDWLRRNRDAWTQPAGLADVHWDVDQQLHWMRRVCEPYYAEVAGLQFYERLLAGDVGPGYGPIESQVLHCFIRTFAPARVVEIGSGASTACMLKASSLNAAQGRRESRITCVEPFPRAAFRSVGNVIHVEQLCQTVPEVVFLQLQTGDLLFVDSSHAVRTGSDVIRIYLDIIPKLPAGVYVHIHDINLPYAYARDALGGYFASQETALLLALLTGSERLRILSCLSALHYRFPVELQRLLTDYQPQADHPGTGLSATERGHFPSSAWLETG